MGTYTADLRLYARWGCDDQQEEFTLQAFVWGLQPEQLKEHIRLTSPSSLVAALGEAEQVEQIMFFWAKPSCKTSRAE